MAWGASLEHEGVLGFDLTRPALPDIPLQADETTTLLAFLDFHRAALIDRAYGLDYDQLQVALAPSSLTLSRLISHMALVEYNWFRDRFANQAMPQPWLGLDFDSDRDAEMTLAQTWPIEELIDHFNAAVVESRIRVNAAESLLNRVRMSSSCHKCGAW